MQHAAAPRPASTGDAERRTHLHWDWDAYRYFVVLARCGVMRRAAEELAVSVATLSRRIEQLESALGLCLFQRKPHGIVLTQAGRQILENCEHISDAFEVLEQSMKGGATAVMDHVDVSVDSMLARLLLPALPPFLAANAGITVNLTTCCTNRQDTGDADLTFGFMRPERGRRRIRRLADLTMSMAVPAACREAERSALPIWTFSNGVWLGRQQSSAGATALRISHLEDVASLVRDGFGGAMLPDYLIDSHTDLARFDPPGMAVSTLILPVWMSLDETASRSSAVRSVASICSDMIQSRIPFVSIGEYSSDHLPQAGDAPLEPGQEGRHA
ncbi:LysR family transcriptional regulator [Paraburkholderia solisilvae]|uniref:LysR family transcriptional regulator n=1 Tax=Paraburkholderia solisilvae TaxID=624376 RepID=UPI0015831295|nr:LysR family transcriptional regulator [Paraburkholderia solisilvae]